VRIAITGAITLAIATALHSLVERPALRLKDRLEPAARRPVPQPAASASAAQS